MTDRIEALERLQRLRETGALTEEEFAAEKAALLGRADAAAEVRPAEGATETTTVAVKMRRPEWLIPAIVAGALLVFIVAALLILRGGGGGGDTPGDTGATVNAAAPAPAPPVVNEVQPAPEPAIRSRPASEQLAAAFATAFGGRATRTVDEAEIRFRPGSLTWIGNRAVLVSNGTNSEECHACAGMVAVHYLTPEGDGFRSAGEWLTVATDDYGRPPDWRISSELTGRPALRVENGGGNQGIFCNFTSYYDLSGARPTEIARVQTGYANEGEEGGFELEGRIANVRRGRSFDAVYTGYESFTETYRFRGSRFVNDVRESRVPGC
jgi:hypothetical protein